MEGLAAQLVLVMLHLDTIHLLTQLSQRVLRDVMIQLGLATSNVIEFKDVQLLVSAKIQQDSIRILQAMQICA